MLQYWGVRMWHLRKFCTWKFCNAGRPSLSTVSALLGALQGNAKKAAVGTVKSGGWLGTDSNNIDLDKW